MLVCDFGFTILDALYMMFPVRMVLSIVSFVLGLDSLDFVWVFGARVFCGLLFLGCGLWAGCFYLACVCFGFECWQIVCVGFCL